MNKFGDKLFLYDVRELKVRNAPLDILVLGNGFDIAHKLPTNYDDFLTFCTEVFSYSWDGDALELEDYEESMSFTYGILSKLNISKHEIQDTFLKIEALLKNNIWYFYFADLNERKDIPGENWIDFEREIASVIKELDNTTQNLETEYSLFFHVMINKLSSEKKINDFLNTEIDNKDKIKIFLENSSRILKNKEEVKTLKNFRTFLFNDLQRFIHAFELYLYNFVEKIPVCYESPDIGYLFFDYIFTFNYTHTYSNFKFIDIDPERITHVHGECKNSSSSDKINMVLGIDEYWDNSKKNTHTNYSIFKKLVQRIQKKTAQKNYDFLSRLEFIDIHDDNLRKQIFFNIYFFGHSLDSTDKDILKSLFELKNAKFIIFYHIEEAEGSLIENVIKLIGQDSLVEKMKEGRLEFRKLQKMREV